MSSRPSILITGASSGIGRACARRLAEDGFFVFAGVRTETAGDELRKQLEVNLFGQLAVTRALLPQLRRWRGRIVFTGSVSGLVRRPGHTVGNAVQRQDESPRRRRIRAPRRHRRLAGREPEQQSHKGQDGGRTSESDSLPAEPCGTISRGPVQERASPISRPSAEPARPPSQSRCRRGRSPAD